MSLDALYFPSLTETWKSSNRNTKIKIKLLMFFLCYYMRVSNGNMGLSNGNLPRLHLKNFKYWSTFVFNVLSKKFVSTQARFQDEFVRPKSTWRRMAGFSGSCGRRWSDPRKWGAVHRGVNDNHIYVSFPFFYFQWVCFDTPIWVAIRRQSIRQNVIEIKVG